MRIAGLETQENRFAKLRDYCPRQSMPDNPGVRHYRHLPLVLVLLLAVGVPLAIAADPSASPDASGSPGLESGSPEASDGVTSPEASAPESASPGPASPEATQAPSATPTPQPTAQPNATGQPDKGAKPDKEKESEKGPESAVTLTGTISESTNGKGWKTYTLTVGSTTYELSAGPPWFWGDKNPLAPYVGNSVQVSGTTHQGSTEVDVESVNGKAIREPGKPPWAGGPWVVGERHPGWKPWMLGGKHGRGHGRAQAPGRL